MASDPNDFAVREHSVVRTADGNELGRVKEVTHSHFLIDVPHEPDYWLSKAVIRTTDDDRVELGIEERQLPAFKLSDPAADAASPAIDASMNTFSSTAEQRRTREEMREGYGPHDAHQQTVDYDPAYGATPHYQEDWEMEEPGGGMGKKILGGLAALMVLAGLVFWMMRRRGSDKTEETKEELPAAVLVDVPAFMPAMTDKRRRLRARMLMPARKQEHGDEESKEAA